MIIQFFVSVVIISTTLYFFLIQQLYGGGSMDSQDFCIKSRGDTQIVLNLNHQKEQFQYKVSQQRKTLCNNTTYENISTHGTLKFYLDYLKRSSLNYGAHIKVNTNTSKLSLANINIAQEMKIYFSNKFGILEVGSTDPILNKLSPNLYLATRNAIVDGISYFNSGFIYFNTHYNIPSTTSKVVYNDIFITAPKLPSVSDSVNKSNKINYFTSKINGFRFALSFAPDIFPQLLLDNNHIMTRNFKNEFKNIIQFGGTYDCKVQDVHLSGFILSEFGQAEAYRYIEGRINRSKLSAWQLGSVTNIGNITFLAIYGNNGDSGSSQKNRNNDSQYSSDYWNISSIYTYKQLAMSINYFESRRVGYIFGYNADIVNLSSHNKDSNQFSCISSRVNYKFLNGIASFIEYYKFKFHKNDNFVYNLSNKSAFNHGYTVIIGTKLRF